MSEGLTELIEKQENESIDKKTKEYLNQKRNILPNLFFNRSIDH